ncbi:MAG: hypothetical protein LBT97_06845 [Planctomycetota bacterium]|nr:hypothetical protein [Planctomycetota bacterium]
MVLRPGALGDVLSVRTLLAYAKLAVPDWALACSAPGGRGRMLLEHGLADAWLDWDSFALSWLFAGGGTPPPPALRSFFANAGLVLAFIGSPPDGGGERTVETRLRALAPEASIRLLPSRPPAGFRGSIHSWLVIPLREWLRDRFARPAPPLPPLESLGRLRIACAPAFPIPPGNYAVIHPGSGSAAKNWNIANFAEVSARLGKERRRDGRRLFTGVFATAGEADGTLGADLASLLPGAALVESPPLYGLAALLSRAALYIGNDSGVSHLAAAVESPEGKRPATAVVFGPSDSKVWAPPGAVVLEAGEKMAALDPGDAARRIAAFLRDNRH